MAKVTITIEDVDGAVHVNMEAVPPFAGEVENFTEAQHMAVVAFVAMQEGGEITNDVVTLADGTQVNGPRP